MSVYFKNTKKEKCRLQSFVKNGEGFTLIELIVSVAIIALLSGIILFSITQYISRAKDSNISGSLAILVPAGEVYYNIENAANQDGYNGFCDPSLNSVLKSAIGQMPKNPNGSCPYASTIPASGNVSLGNPAGVCCYVSTPYDDSWAACAQEFTTPTEAYCVDSRGEKEEITNNQCLNTVSNTSMCP